MCSYKIIELNNINVQKCYCEWVVDELYLQHKNVKKIKTKFMINVKS